jgi:hypothetical protein
MKSIILFFCSFAFTLDLQAEIMVGASLEWLADTSPGIGVYEVTRQNRESASAFQLSFRLEKTLKGTPPENSGSPYWVRSSKESSETNIANGNRFLLFFKLDEKDTLRVAHLINLSTPQLGGMESTAINSRFEVITDPAKILAVVQERIKSHPKALPTKWHEYPDSRFDVEVPTGSAAHAVLWGGSTCYLLLPQDLKPAGTK